MTTENEARPDAPSDDPFDVKPGAGSPGFSLAQAIGARNLLIVIITMPLVFLIVVMATISIFGRPGADDDNMPALASVEPTGDAGSLDVLSQPAVAGYRGVTAPTMASALAIDPSPLVIPEGAKISAMALDGDRLVLRVDGEGGGEIVIYDLERGAAAQRIRVLKQMQTVDEGL